jgi:hypothetical protein
MDPDNFLDSVFYLAAGGLLLMPSFPTTEVAFGTKPRSATREQQQILDITPVAYSLRPHFLVQ